MMQLRMRELRDVFDVVPIASVPIVWVSDPGIRQSPKRNGRWEQHMSAFDVFQRPPVLEAFSS